ncbi:hypothetical protein [Paenibacillus selenitireducens]|nr:hypothetical protein [Paenibacillus selenitireducens]
MPEEEKVSLIERLAKFYHSDYVKHNQPWVRDTPYPEWLEKQLNRLGAT